MGFERLLMVVPVCDCCRNVGKPGATSLIAYEAALLAGWDVPAGKRDEWCEGWVRCPRCVRLGRWPAETARPATAGGPSLGLTCDAAPEPDALAAG